MATRLVCLWGCSDRWARRRTRGVCLCVTKASEWLCLLHSRKASVWHDRGATFWPSVCLLHSPYLNGSQLILFVIPYQLIIRRAATGRFILFSKSPWFESWCGQRLSCQELFVICHIPLTKTGITWNRLRLLYSFPIHPTLQRPISFDDYCFCSWYSFVWHRKPSASTKTFPGHFLCYKCYFISITNFR
jgi:hypothetical protein